MSDASRHPIPAVRLEIASRPELLASVRSMVVSFGERAGLDDIASGHLALAVDEALANVIRHGYRSRADGRIWMTLSALDHPEPRIRIEIEDEGDQIDPEEIRPRALEDVRPGGLGVHIIREVTDHCEFSRRPGTGMSLVMEKNIPAPSNDRIPSIIPPSIPPSSSPSSDPHQDES